MPRSRKPLVPRFHLAFSARLIPELAERYSAGQSLKERQAENLLVDDVGLRIRGAGYLSKERFLALCHWKSARRFRLCQENSADRVEEASRLAFSARDEALRVGILTVLDGVSWPTASVLLHFGHRDPYPVLDFRALESLGVPQPSQYTFGFWWAYVVACRNLAEQHRVDMRTLDRALWQDSAEKARAQRRQSRHS